MSYQLSHYKRRQVEASSPAEILILLFNTAVVRARTAIKNCDPSQDAVRGEAVRKLLDIVIELRSTLDRSLGGELAENLDQLYDFVITTVIEANTERDAEKFQQALNVLDVLRDGFSQAAKQVAENPEEFEQARQEAEVQRQVRQEELKAELKASEVKVEAPPAAEAQSQPEAKVEALPKAPPPTKRPRSVAVKRYSAF